MRQYLTLLLPLLFAPLFLYGQSTIPRMIRSDTSSHFLGLVPSNSISYMQEQSGTLWLGTSNGLARSVDYGNGWESFNANSAFANRGIFALTVKGDTIWTATGYDYQIEGGSSVHTGSGYAYSIDDGATWTHRDQPLDSRGDSIIAYGINDSLRILPVVVPQQNVTYDISLSDYYVWIASWSSGLRKSTDNGQTWERILLPTDDLSSLTPDDTLWSYAETDTLQEFKIWKRFDPRANNNLLAFSVYAANNDTIWCGTAGGVNKSTNGGFSWVRFTHQNQRKGILGNWVVAINEQHVNNIHRVWTTNWKADDASEDYGVSYTENGGESWKNLLPGVKAYDFAFKDSIVYIASDNGVYRTTDNGATFQLFSTFIDSVTRAYLPQRTVYSVSVIEDTVYLGTDDGLVSSIDNAMVQFGSSWKVIRTYEKVGTQMKTYAYPNPYSPPVDNIVRIHYGGSNFNAPDSDTRKVSIELFDFGMNRVRTLITDAIRSQSREYDEPWDGKDNDGNIVPNGVYFYRVVIDGGEPMFGKILVMQ